MLSGSNTPLNAVATAVPQITFVVTNNTAGALQNQKILVFLTPALSGSDYFYAAWQQLNPPDGAASRFMLNGDIAAYLDDSPSASVYIPPGYCSRAVQDGTANPHLTVPEPSPLLTPQQSGVQNGMPFYYGVTVAWTVNGNLVVQTATPLKPGSTSSFELQNTLYWAVGNPTIGATYARNQITPMQTYSVPAGVTKVGVSVTYNRTTSNYDFAFTN